MATTSTNLQETDQTDVPTSSKYYSSSSSIFTDNQFIYYIDEPNDTNETTLSTDHPDSHDSNDDSDLELQDSQNPIWVDDDSDEERIEADIRRRGKIWTGKKEKEEARPFDRVENFFEEEAEEDGEGPPLIPEEPSDADCPYTEEERLDGFVTKDDEEVIYDTDYEEEIRAEEEQDEKHELERLETKEKTLKKRLRKLQTEIKRLKQSRKS
jgi:hypothetical protein